MFRGIHLADRPRNARARNTNTQVAVNGETVAMQAVVIHEVVTIEY